MNFNILAIIPARGGSKGIKKKNLKKINGMSLVNRAVVSAQKSNFISDIFVSTDCNDTISEVEKNGNNCAIQTATSIVGGPNR